MVGDLLTITKKLKSSHPNLTNFIQILFQVNLNRMWDIWSFFFQLYPTFSFCWDICRFSFDYVPHFPFVGTYADFLSDYVPFLDFCGRFPRLFFAYVLLSDFCGRFPRLFLHMSCFRISVGGFLAFFAYVLLSDFCGRFPCLFWHMSHLLLPPQNLYQMILICLSTYPVYKFPEQNTLIFLPFRII